MARPEDLEGFKPSDELCPECAEKLVEKEEDGDMIYRCLDCDQQFDEIDLLDQDELDKELTTFGDDDDDDGWDEEDDEDEEGGWECSGFDTREERKGEK